jgi:hypothetical protein
VVQASIAGVPWATTFRNHDVETLNTVPVASTSPENLLHQQDLNQVNVDSICVGISIRPSPLSLTSPLPPPSNVFHIPPQQSKSIRRRCPSVFTTHSQYLEAISIPCQQTQYAKPTRPTNHSARTVHSYTPRICREYEKVDAIPH